MPLPISREKVTFATESATLVGDLYHANGPGGPAVVVSGSWTTVKEQMAGRYAAGLAERGVTALAFDFTGYGESEGSPRDWESPGRKISDIGSAVSFLRSQPGLDHQRIGVLGICAGAGYTAVATARDTGIRSIALVAPWLHDSMLIGELYGGPEGVAQRIAAGEEAWKKYQATGEVDYVPAVSAENPDAAMYGPFDYYLDADRGAIPQWGNRFAVMAWPGWLAFDPISQAPGITTPALLVHSEQAAIPAGAVRFHQALPGPKKFLWLEGTQFDFYDQDQAVNPALDAVGEHFANTL